MIRQRVSLILDMAIPKGKIAEYAGILDASGAFSKKTMQDIILALCDEVEELQENQKIQDLPAPVIMEHTAFVTPKVSYEELFQCDKCDRTFKAKIALLGHQRSHKEA